MSFLDAFADAAREITSAGRRPRMNYVRPRDETAVPARDLPASGDELDGDQDFRKQVEELCALVALFAESLPRFSPHSIPVDRVRKAINDLERMVDHASADLG